METVNQKALENCLKTAKAAGVLREQAQALLESGYIPLPWQWEFHAQARRADQPGGPVDIGLGGARGPGKSHAVLSQTGLDDCQRVKGLKGLFLRQTGIAAKESFDDLVNKVLKDRVGYTKSGHILKFNNDSRIVLGGFQDQNDIDKYIGIEYDFIIVEELNQLTADKYTKLRGSLRTSKPNWRPRMYTSFNPGGIGHGFVKDRYIIPFRSGNQKDTVFVGSNYKANPYLNKEYIEYLESLSGDLGRAWREGEWDLFAGQAFSELRADKHLIEPFEIPDWWTKFGAYDHGFNHPFSFGEFAVDDDGNVYLYRRVSDRLKRVDEISEMIGDTSHLSFIYAGHDCWNKGRGGEPTIAEQFRKCRKPLSLVKANIARVAGASQIRQYIAWQKTIKSKDGTMVDGKPKFYIFRSEAAVYEVLTRMIFDDKRPEDVLKVDAVEGVGGDDDYDMVRMGLMSRPKLSKEPDKDIDKTSGDYLLKLIENERLKKRSLSYLV